MPMALEKHSSTDGSLAARKYRPACIRLLLVAPSPANADGHFYSEDEQDGDVSFPEACHVLFEGAAPRLPIVDVPVPFPTPTRGTEFRQRFRQAIVRAGLENLIRSLPAARAE